MKKWVRQLISGGSLRGGLIVTACASGFFILFLFRLGSLTPGLSVAELSARGGSSNIHAIIENPINAPHKIIQYSLQTAGIHSQWSLRLVSVFWAAIFIGCFFYLAKRWFGKMIGLLGTVLFASTPWFIIAARSVTPTIMLLMPLTIAACFVWSWRSKNHTNIATVLLAAIIAMALYTPGAIWFVLLAGILSSGRLKTILKKNKFSSKIFAIALFLLLITPLVRAILLDPAIAKTLLLLPGHFGGVIDQLKSLGWSFLAILWHTRDHQILNIARWPLLSGPQLVLLVFGLFAMITQAKKETYMLITFVLVVVLAAAINMNSVFLVMALPALIMLAAAGLRYLFVEWRTIFPHNPIPKTLAITLMVVLVAFQFVFGAHYTLSAWAHSPSIQNAYHVKIN